MCAQAAEAPEQQARGQGESFDYDAFISYAHEDRPVAAGSRKACTASAGEWASCTRCGCFATPPI